MTRPEPWIRDVGEVDFERLVVARSHEVPVVVDFWAAWCGPCRMLGPALEREIAALGGRAELAKVDTDANPQLAADFGIRGIPAVKAFRAGRVVAEFEGARDPAFLRRWLAEVAPSPAREAFAAAERAARAGGAAVAEAGWRGLTDDAEVGAAATLALARLLLDAGRPEEVPALLARVDPRGEAAERVPALERRLQFVTDAAAFGGAAAARAALVADGRNLDARWALASALAARGDTAGALEELLAIVTQSRRYRDDGARLAMLALFETLGPDSDLAREHRRRLQIVT